MNKCVLNVVPFILNESYRNIKAFHHYTVEEVKEIDLYELTELALLIPQFLQPEGWKFRYSWNEGDVVTVAANPQIFHCPAPGVLDAIISRVEAEGYMMFNTIRNHFLFLEWDWEFIGCLNDESFLFNIERGIKCCHVGADLYYKDGGLFVEEWDLELNDWGLVPLGGETVDQSKEQLLKVLDFLSKKDVLQIVIK